jgi:hypothetical protein
MSADDITFLASKVPGDFINDLHRVNFVPTLAAIAGVAQDVAGYASATLGYANAAASSYALQAVLGTPAAGIGPGALQIARNVEQGSAAYVDVFALKGIWPVLLAAAYQILPTDFGKMLFWPTLGAGVAATLPLASEVPDGWFTLARNRSGFTVTATRQGADTLNNGATTVAIASGPGLTFIVKRDSTGFEVMA